MDMNTSLINSKPKPVKTLRAKAKSVKKVSSRGRLIAQAHSIMRDIVIKRDGFCVCPAPEKGHSDVLQAGHLIKSTKGSVRFDLYNIHCQCRSCNSRHVHYEKYYLKWFISKFGGDEYVRLCDLADGTGLKSYELEELIVQLKLIREKQIADKEFRPYFTQSEILSGAWSTK
jgi:hypothetical protein